MLARCIESDNNYEDGVVLEANGYVRENDGCWHALAPQH